MRKYTSDAPAGKRLRRLNSRQRKKMHVGDFQQLAFEVKASLKEDAQDDTLLVAMINMIEARRLQFGGSVGRNRFEGVVSAERGSPTEEDRQAVEQWLTNRDEVKTAHVGEFTDAWYGQH